jgi:hypothetical protein
VATDKPNYASIADTVRDFGIGRSKLYQLLASGDVRRQEAWQQDIGVNRQRRGLR